LALASHALFGSHWSAVEKFELTPRAAGATATCPLQHALLQSNIETMVGIMAWLPNHWRRQLLTQNNPAPQGALLISDGSWQLERQRPAVEDW
jgi:hypothetical protein